MVWMGEVPVSCVDFGKKNKKTKKKRSHYVACPVAYSPLWQV